MAEWTDERIEAVVRAALRDEARARPVQLTSPDILARRRSRTSDGTRPRGWRGPVFLAAVLALGAGSLALFPGTAPSEPVPHPTAGIRSDQAVIVRTDVDGPAEILLADAAGERLLTTIELDGLLGSVDQHSVSRTGWLQLPGVSDIGRTILDIADPSHRVSFADATALEFGPDGRAWMLRGRGIGAVVELFDPATDTSTLVDTAGDGPPTRLVVRADGEALIPRAGSLPPGDGAGVRFWYGLEVTGRTRPGEPYLARYDAARLPSPGYEVLSVCGLGQGPCFDPGGDPGSSSTDDVTAGPGPEGVTRHVLEGLPSSARLRWATWAPPVPWPPDPGDRPSADAFGIWVTALRGGFDSQGELWRLGSDGGAVLALTFPLAPDHTTDAPTFSGDGSLVALRVLRGGVPARTILGDLSSGIARSIDGAIGGFVSGDVAARLLGPPDFDPVP